MQQTSTLPTISVMFGIVLIATGVVAYFHPSSFGVGKHITSEPAPPAIFLRVDGRFYEHAHPKAPTSLVPAGFGAVLLIAGIMAIANPNARKHAMHAAAAASLLGAIGGLVPVMMRHSDLHESAVKVGYILTASSMIFLALCINSFVQARTARKEGETAPTTPARA